MITVYTSPNCIKCKILKSQLEGANINYAESENYNELPKGMLSLPVVKVDDAFLTFELAIIWIERQRN